MAKPVNATENYGFRREEDRGFPPMVFAEITNICNLKCIHCPYSYILKQKSYIPRHMELGIFKKIVDEISQYKGTILRLVCDGEPMMHPDFLEIITYSRQKGISPLCLNTNGTLLEEVLAREILQQNVEVVEVSLDAFTKDTYERIRLGADFEKVVSNVETLIRLKKDLNSDTKIMVSIIDQPEVSSEIDAFKAYWGDKVDQVITRTYTSIGGLVDHRKMAPCNDRERWPCPLLWTRVFINVDGLIKFCVEDWLDHSVVGDIREESIKDAWQSEEYQKLRQGHLRAEFWQNNHCRDCVDWPARRWDYDYFYALDKILKNKS